MQGIDEARVGAWLDANVEGATGPYGYELIAGGRSNLTYRVTDANGMRMVLRRPPLGHVLATAHDMAREHRIISAVGSTGVPVPRCLGLCTDEEVNGAPFYVMAFVDGVVLDSPDKGELLPQHLRTAASEHLVDVLADLHAVDVDPVENCGNTTLVDVGDPLADLGYIGIYWTDPGQPINRANDPSGLAGFPAYDDLVERYARRTGRDVSNIGYYKAFSSFRLAVISEGVYARYLKGAMGNQDFDPTPMKLGTENLAEAALAALKGQ